MKKEIMKTYDELKDIACPHCGEVQFIEIADRGSDFVTFWGEESVEEECCECKKKFFIQERVSREWEVAKDWNNF